MAELLSPFVYWAQTETNITLRVDLKNVTSPEVLLNEDELEFTAVGLGAKGRNEYHFVLEFFLAVLPSSSQYRVSEREVEFVITKKTNQYWPRLTVDQKKPVWLKIDFDKWVAEDDDDDVDSESIEQQIKEILDPTKEEEMHDDAYRRIYLFMYNLFQLCGFAVVLLILLFHLIKDGDDCYKNAYSNAGVLFLFFQAFQLLEIAFGWVGWTKTKILFPSIQTIGRLLILVLFIVLEPRMHDQPVVFNLFVVWSVIEVIRYPFYMLKVFDVEFEALTWLRYTIWIPLYPLGFVCEGITIMKNIPYYEETKRFSYHLPNVLNWSFDLPSLMRVYLLFISFPLMFTLMFHMFQQRRRIFGPTTSKPKHD